MERKDAIEIIKKNWPDSSFTMLREALETLIPELKESEDERIRKDIVEAVELHKDFTQERKEYIYAWLEKQGKLIEYYEDKLDRCACENFNKGYKAAIEHQKEKQGEQKPVSITDEWIEDYWQHEKVNNPYSHDKGEEIQFDHQGFVRFCKKYCKKPTDKVEPKFKVGEWCIDNEDNTIFQIVKVLDNTYTYKTNEGKEYSCTHYSLENDARLWTIQDAKDGDVLLSSDGSIFIFKEVVDFGCKHYIALATDGTIQVNDNFTHFWESVSGVCPTTKEQRDLLFQKIKEAGYEWDAIKLELKEIDYKSERGNKSHKLSSDEEFILARIMEYLEDNDCPDEWRDLLHDIYSSPYQKQDEQPEHGYLKTVYFCGKKPRWAIGDTLAYYEVYSDKEGECVLGKVTKVEFDNQEENDWVYTFEDGTADCEQALLECATYKKK